VSDTGSSVGTAASRWQREVNEKIKQKLRLLREEFEEISFLKQVADEAKNLRKKSLTEKCD